jgi:uncharacterized protein YjbI with pentapeptide repeats
MAAEPAAANSTTDPWEQSMLQNPPAGTGCFVSSPGGGGWQPAPCGTASDAPNMPPAGSSADEVGNTDDEVATSSGPIIGSSIGTFPAIDGLTSEVGGTGAPAFPGSTCLTGDGTPNCYSLQLNTQTFSCNTPWTGGVTTTCWEQFVSSDSGELYIQYWVLGYCHDSGGSNCGDSSPFNATNPAPSFSCPSMSIPSGSGWMMSGGDCYANSAMTSPPTTAATSLGTLTLSGFANYMSSGNDVIMLCISGGSCYSVTIQDNIVNLFENWHDSEFNVFGDASGSQAVFNAGTTILVSNQITDESGDSIPASCNNTGYTGESNNLFLGSCTGDSGGITFVESSQTFNFAGTQTDSTVLASGLATFAVSLDLTNGPGSPVGLSVIAGLPSGATASFSPNTVTPSGGSTLTITTTPSVALGDFALTIEGTFGLYTVTTSVNLHVYDFGVTLSSDDTVLRGTSAIYTVALTLLPGSSTTGVPAMTLSVSGAPSDSTTSFSAATETPTDSGCSLSTLEDCQYLTVATNGSPSGSLGDYSLSVSAVNSGLSGGPRSATTGLNIYDFNVGLSPGSATIPLGASTSYTVTLTLAPGSSAPPAISLTSSGLPSGSTSNLSPNTVTPTLAGATSTLTVNTFRGSPGPTALGDFAPTIQGTDNVDLSSGSRSGSAGLHIFDYTVSLTPSSATLFSGSSTMMSVGVGLVPGSTTVGLPSVSTTLTGLPSGVTISGFPSSLGIGSSQTFTLSTIATGGYVSCPQVSSHGGQNLKDADLAHCDLAGYNLGGDNLQGANLMFSDLQNANLGGCNLQGADLASAFTLGANFQGTNMAGVDLSSASSIETGTFTLTATGMVHGQSRSGTATLTVYGDDLNGGDFQGANLSGANLAGDLAMNANFQGTNMQQTNLSGAVFSGSSFQGVNLQGADLAGDLVTNANFQGTNMQQTNLSGGTFAGSTFQGSNLSNSNMSNGDFNSCDFQGTNTRGANITGATFVGAIDAP